MDRKTEHIVRLRAGGVCEYCRLPQSVSHLTFPLDHIIARQHGGPTIEGNLAVACPECNLRKGPNLAELDPANGELTRLFNPRADAWSEHFQWERSVLVGLTAIGRTTIRVLGVIDPLRVAVRQALMDDGIFPQSASQRNQSQ